MRLFKYEAKEIFENSEIPVPNDLIARSPSEVASATKNRLASCD